MNKKELSKNVGITVRHFNMILSGVRNASPKTARLLAKATSSPKGVWVFGAAIARRAVIERVLSD